MSALYIPLVFLILGSAHSFLVEDLEVIYSQHGVSPHFFYNETNNANGQMVSAPGCPSSIKGFPWIYYGNPPRCFLAETIGPCPLGQRLVPQRDSQYGICVCGCILNDYTLGALQTGDRFIRCPNFEMAKFGEYGKGWQVFDNREKKCYNMYEKGPCQRAGTVVADFTSTSLTCLPLCDIQDEDSVEKFHKKICTVAAPMPAPTLPYGTLRHRCQSPDLKYSKTLRKCIRRGTAKPYVVG